MRSIEAERRSAHIGSVHMRGKAHTGKQATLRRLGSDDGGKTWRMLKPGERAKRTHTELGPPEGWEGEWTERTDEEAIEREADRGAAAAGRDTITTDLRSALEPHSRRSQLCVGTAEFGPKRTFDTQPPRR